MKRFIPFMMALAIYCICLLGGCTQVFTINPLYTKETVVYEPSLVGKWMVRGETEPTQLWDVEKGDGDSYKITMMDPEGKAHQFFGVGRLVKIGDRLFADLDINVKDHFLPGTEMPLPDQTFLDSEKGEKLATYHILFRVTITDQAVVLFDFGKGEARDLAMKDLKKRTVVSIDKDGIKSSGDMVGATTAELQKFFAAQGAEMTGNPATLGRIGGALNVRLGEGL